MASCLKKNWQKGAIWLVGFIVGLILTFIEENHKNPSKFRIVDHDMLNWLKANRKVMNAGKMKPERVELFNRLLTMCEKYRHVNQYM